MERSNLICVLVGWFSAKDTKIDGKDMQILIDNWLFESKFTPLGNEPNDLQLLDELLSEIMMSVIGKEINRETRRKRGVVKTK